jgi:hypothetical protein
VPGGETLFQWRPSRGSAYPEEIVPPEFRGTLQCDAYGAYPAFAATREGIILAGCWAHARRGFHEALPFAAADAARVLALVSGERLGSDPSRHSQWMQHGGREAFAWENAWERLGSDPSRHSKNTPGLEITEMQGAVYRRDPTPTPAGPTRRSGSPSRVLSASQPFRISRTSTLRWRRLRRNGDNMAATKPSTGPQRA